VDGVRQHAAALAPRRDDDTIGVDQRSKGHLAAARYDELGARDERESGVEASYSTAPRRVGRPRHEEATWQSRDHGVASRLRCAGDDLHGAAEERAIRVDLHRDE